MASNKLALLNILISLIFACLIIGAAQLFQGEEYKDTVTYLLIALCGLYHFRGYLINPVSSNSKLF